MAERDVPIDDTKLAIIDKSTDYRVVLLLMAFALSADLALVTLRSESLITVSWQELGARPGPMLLFLIGFGVLMSVLAPLLTFLLTQVLRWPVQMAQDWLNLMPSHENPDSHRFVRISQAEGRLAAQPNDSMRQRLEAQREKRAKEISRWQAMVNCSVVCLALIACAWWTDGTWVHSIEAWNSLVPLALVAAAALPFSYHLWVGRPGHDWVEWPELARELLKERIPAYFRGVPGRDPDVPMGT